MRISSCLLFVASLSLLVACGGKEDQPASPPAASAQSWPATQATDGGSFTVTIEPEGGKVLRNQHFSVDVELEAKDGESAGITVSVDADMPAHRHGMNTKPEVSAIDGAGYRAEGMLFHMGGDWVIKVDVTRGGTTESASFPVSVE